PPGQANAATILTTQIRLSSPHVAAGSPDFAALHPGYRPLFASTQVGAEPLDAFAGLLQRRCCGRVGNPERRAYSERRPLHHRDAFSVQKLSDEILVGLDGVARRGSLAHGAGAGRIDVERALRLRTLDALRLVEHGNAEVAAFLEDLVVLRDEVLRPV